MILSIFLKVLAVFLSAAAGALAKQLIDAPRRKREERLRVEAEGRERALAAELALRKRRELAPQFILCDDGVHTLFDGLQPIEVFDTSDQTRVVLCNAVPEVDPESRKTFTVLLLVKNVGPDPRTIDTELELQGRRYHARWVQDAKHYRTKGLCWFAYPYDRSKHGMPCKLLINIRTRDGSLDTHTYETRHGCRCLTWVDPG